MTIPVKPINEIEVKAEVSASDKILILDSDSQEARLASKDELKWDKWDKGDTWAKWDTWPQWPQWPKWDTWDKGAKGDTWATGAQWPKWDTGMTGAQWPQWPQGAKWDKGDKGDTWATWSKWDKWDKWDKGDKWDTWSKWDTWAQWPQGETWPTWNWISTVTTSKSWKTTTVTMNYTDGWDPTVFQIQDGADGQGSWDMNMSTYDPTSKMADAFDYDNMYNTPSLWTAASKDTGTSSGNVPVLDSNWKLNTSTLPWVALTDTFTVTNKSDLTSLSSADQWDIWIVTSESKTYVLSQAPYSTAANWKELLTPTDAVTSVNSKTWAVTLNADDISDSSTTNKFVTASDKTTWSWKQDALSAQTAYTSKWTASKVPQITTNTLGQVTGITEVNISYPSQVDDTAYASSWDWVTDTAPSKNAVYDKIQSVVGSIPTVPSNVSAFTNDAWYTTNTGTITSVKMNGSTVSSSWEADLWTVITSHQSIKTLNSTSLVWTWNVTVNEVPSWWTQWQVLTKWSSGYAWATPSWWDVMVSDQANNILTSWMKIWAWTQTNYEWLWTYDSNTVYLTIE